MVFTCGSCWREFYAGWKARDQHCDATGHRRPRYECDDCDEYFDNEDERRDHMDAFGHWGSDAEQCNICALMFPDNKEREGHELNEHLYCADCDRSFSNRNNMKMHRNSSRHRNSNVNCPFCGGGWNTATGLVHHLERGACPRAPLDRDQIYRMIRRYDPSGSISKKFIGWEGSVAYEATEMSYNYQLGAYECYLCHNLFNNLSALNQHLASPRHQQALYHCPNRACRKEFAVLGGLVNHLESESCGFMRFGQVQRNVTQLINPNRMIQF